MWQFIWLRFFAQTPIVKEAIYKCEHCPVTVRHAFELKNHLIAHIDRKQFSCSLCVATFKHPCSHIRTARRDFVQAQQNQAFETFRDVQECESCGEKLGEIDENRWKSMENLFEVKGAKYPWWHRKFNLIDGGKLFRSCCSSFPFYLWCRQMV